MRFLPERLASRAIRIPVAAIVACLLAAAAGSASAAGFAVSPIRLEFERSVKTGSTTVTNDADEPLELQVRAFEWSQDAEGKDVYTQTADLIVFPAAINLEAQGRQLIRIGTRIPAVDKEKTYRVFIEELPRRTEEGKQRAQVAIRVRFGVPVFVKPLEPQVTGEIQGVKVEDGKLNVLVRNLGNVHFYAESVVVQAGDTSYPADRGWYVLAGATRRFAVVLPPEACRAASLLKVSVKGQGVELASDAKISPEECSGLSPPTK
jgi:fimbrial chaperone protein